MRARTDPAIADSVPAASSARLVHFPPARAARLFDAPDQLTMPWEVVGLHLLGWLFLAIWLLQPAKPAPEPEPVVTALHR